MTLGASAAAAHDFTSRRRLQASVRRRRSEPLRLVVAWCPLARYSEARIRWLRPTMNSVEALLYTLYGGRAASSRKTRGRNDKRRWSRGTTALEFRLKAETTGDEAPSSLRSPSCPSSYSISSRVKASSGSTKYSISRSSSSSSGDGGGGGGGSSAGIRTFR